MQSVARRADRSGLAALVLSERLGPWDILGVVVVTLGILEAATALA